MLEKAIDTSRKHDVALTTGNDVCTYVVKNALHHNFLVYMTKRVWEAFCASQDADPSAFALLGDAHAAGAAQIEQVIVVNIEKTHEIDVPVMEMFPAKARGNSALLLATEVDLGTSSALRDFTNLYPNNLGAFVRVGNSAELAQDVFKITEAIKKFRRQRSSFKDTNVIVGNQTVASRFNGVGYANLESFVVQQS